MAIKKCPLCQGRLVKGECPSCGYTVPSEEDLSAIYNYDPSDYPQPEEPLQMREITPEVQTEEIYPNRAEPPKFKVHDEGGKTVMGSVEESPFANKGSNAAEKPGPFADNGNPYANHDGSFKPYNSPFANPSPSPYANTGNTSGNSNTEILKEFAQKYWWYWLILLFAPWLIAVVITSILMRNGVVDKKYRWIFIVSLIISIILPPW